MSVSRGVGKSGKREKGRGRGRGKGIVVFRLDHLLWIPAIRKRRICSAEGEGDLRLDCLIVVDLMILDTLRLV